VLVTCCNTEESREAESAVEKIIAGRTLESQSYCWLISTAQASEQMPLSFALSSPWSFLRPTNDLHTNVVDSRGTEETPWRGQSERERHLFGCLGGTSRYSLGFGPGSVVDAQTARRQLNKKRKRSDLESDSVTQLQLRKLHGEDRANERGICSDAWAVLADTVLDLDCPFAIVSNVAVELYWRSLSYQPAI
jgi:hypothetical protein